jgi:AcrR family transcriptional regulator
VSSSERIIDATVELFYRKGYEATSLREVADAVGLQVGSLYNHISSKEDLLFGIMRGVMIELIAHTRAAMEQADDATARITAFMEASITFHARRQKETFIGNSELRSLDEPHHKEVIELRDEYQQLMSDALTAAKDEGRLAIDDVQLATFAGLAICSSVATWYRPEGRLSIDALVQRLPLQFGPLALAVGSGERR